MVYSDLSLITMMYVLGTVAMTRGYVRAHDLNPACAAAAPSLQRGTGVEQCFYEAYVRMYVIDKLRLRDTQFLPPTSVWPDCLPTWNDTTGSSPGPGRALFRSTAGKKGCLSGDGIFQFFFFCSGNSRSPTVALSAA